MSHVLEEICSQGTHLNPNTLSIKRNNHKMVPLPITTNSTNKLVVFI